MRRFVIPAGARRLRWLAMVMVLALVACVATPPQPATPPMPSADVAAMYAAVQAAGKADDRELAVVPLRDPQVEDLRETATAALARRDLGAAADALNQALLLVPDDPAVLQERAEVALLASDLPRAETLVQRAIDLGSAAGPLCRRHWETLHQIRAYRLHAAPPVVAAEAAAEQAGQANSLAKQAADAAAGRDACTVAGFDRM